MTPLTTDRYEIAKSKFEHQRWAEPNRRCKGRNTPSDATCIVGGGRLLRRYRCHESGIICCYYNALRSKCAGLESHSVAGRQCSVWLDLLRTSVVLAIT